MRRRYPALWRRLSASLLLTLLFGCWRYQVRPANPAHLQEPFAYPRNEVFDAVLSQAHEMNLEVKVLEKASGLVRFETIQLYAASQGACNATEHWPDSREYSSAFKPRR